jgi:hypothetical protein
MKIISGGQTGVDRATLDVALLLGLPCGGWCPRGRRAEDGPIPRRYPLRETPSEEYEERTEWNVRDSDGTLILTMGALTGGTALTAEFAKKHQRPVLVVDLLVPVKAQTVRDWIATHCINTLNVAGPRAGTNPNIYELAVKFLKSVLLACATSY